MILIYIYDLSEWDYCKFEITLHYNLADNLVLKQVTISAFLFMQVQHMRRVILNIDSDCKSLVNVRAVSFQREGTIMPCIKAAGSLGCVWLWYS